MSKKNGSGPKPLTLTILVNPESGAMNISHPQNLAVAMKMLGDAQSTIAGKIMQAQAAAAQPEIETAGAGTLRRIDQHRKSGA